MAASPAPEHGPSGGDGLGWLGRGDPVHTQDHGLTERDSEPASEQSRAGEHHRATGKADLGIEAPGEPGWPVHHPAAEDFGQDRLDGGETASRESGVDNEHDRAGAPPSQLPGGTSTGVQIVTGESEQAPRDSGDPTKKMEADSNYLKIWSTNLSLLLQRLNNILQRK